MSHPPHFLPNTAWQPNLTKKAIRVRQKILRLYQTIKPIKLHKSNGFCVLKVDDIFTTVIDSDCPFLSEQIHLKEMMQIESSHTYAYQGFFKPTVAEALASIQEKCPPKKIKRVIAFRLSQRFELSHQQGYHLAKCTLYEKG